MEYSETTKNALATMNARRLKLATAAALRGDKRPPVYRKSALFYSTKPGAKPCSDGNIENLIIKLDHSDVHTGTGLAIDAALWYVVEGFIAPIFILIDGNPLSINDHGRVTFWAGYQGSIYTRRYLDALIARGAVGHDL